MINDTYDLHITGAAQKPVVGGKWFPLGGKMGGESSYIMFCGPKGSKERYFDTEKRFLKILSDYDIEHDRYVIKRQQYPLFVKAMRENGWKYEFIAFGP